MGKEVTIFNKLSFSRFAFRLNYIHHSKEDKMKTRKGFALLLIFVLIMGLGTSRALADSSLINFESYTIGTVNGQDGWSSLGAAGSGCAVYDHQVVDSSAFGITAFGNKSLRMSNAVTSGCFGDQTFSKSLVDEAGETSAISDGLSGGTRRPYFKAQWDFASTTPNSLQSGLSVVASPDRGDGARMSWVQMTDTASGLGVNFYDYQESAMAAICDNDDFVFINVASNLDRTTKHTIKLEMFFLDGALNDVVKIWVDGVLKHTGTSWEDYFRSCEGNPTRPVDSILFRTAGTSAPATAGYGFLIDNLTLFSGSTYQFTGFSQPIDMNATNIAKAGQSIPVKWRLTDANGAPISDPGSFVNLHSQPGSCNNGGPSDAVESYSGSSGLQYLGDGYWQFNWKTPKSYAGTCRTMYVEFQGGLTSPTVPFQFK
jgi:hypothetical protein